MNVNVSQTRGAMPRPAWVTPTAVTAFAFGALTVVSGGLVLFGDPATRAAAGDIVLFVLRFNSLAGFLYMLAAIGLFLWRPWSARLAQLIALATVTVFAVFCWQVSTGGAFEPRTVGAMVLRSGFWIVLALVASRAFRREHGTTSSARP